MEDALLASVIKHAPAWVRYVLTLSEIGSSGEGWVLADRENIAIMDVGDTSAMPLWPSKRLAEGAIGAEDELEATQPAPIATSIPATELAEKVLPALSDNRVSVAVFPGPGENRVIGPEGVIRDLLAFIEEPRDVDGELALEPYTIELEGWASLEVPDMGDEDEEADARFWLLAADDGKSVIGVISAEKPALALFATQLTAEDFARQVVAQATPRPASTDSLIGHWLLMAFSAGWDAAIVTDDGGTGSVKPVRLALDLARVARKTPAA
jgi:hypothetical protein